MPKQKYRKKFFSPTAKVAKQIVCAVCGWNSFDEECLCCGGCARTLPGVGAFIIMLC